MIVELTVFLLLYTPFYYFVGFFSGEVIIHPLYVPIPFLLFCGILFIIASIKESLVLPSFLPVQYLVYRFYRDVFFQIPYYWEL